MTRRQRVPIFPLGTRDFPSEEIALDALGRSRKDTYVPFRTMLALSANAPPEISGPADKLSCLGLLSQLLLCGVNDGDDWAFSKPL
jgi:hypothetical protein